MQVTLTAHSEELLKQQLARGFGNSPEEVIERALEAVVSGEAKSPKENREQRQKAVDRMKAFRDDYGLTLGPNLAVTQLIDEGRKY